jgi:adenylate cyclase
VPAANPRDAGRDAVLSLRNTIKERTAALLQRDPERLAQAVELGLVSKGWLEDPTGQPISTATPTEVVERYLERSVEQRPSMLAALGLSAIQILSSGDEEDGATGEQILAVVFTDLEGFTRFTAEEGDEAASQLLDRHRREVGPVIRSRGGRIVKRLGDGLLVTFLEPDAAVLCCLELLDHQPDPLRLRAGVHVGDVVLAADDVVGHTVNVAARVTESAKGGQLLATTEVRAACDLPRVRFGRARRRSFKGVGEPVSVCPVDWS